MNAARLAAGLEHPCTRCRVRYAGPTGLCRRCVREGEPTPAPGKTVEFERERLERVRAKEAAAAGKVPREHLEPRPDKVVVVNGREYLVAWDGA